MTEISEILFDTEYDVPKSLKQFCKFLFLNV